MGFSVEYKYYSYDKEKKDYNREEELNGILKVGEFNEDITIEELASKVIALMARRNIFVREINIFEFAKKQISYKESDDGITIKNRKFRFDESVLTSNLEVVEDSSNNMQLVKKENKLPKTTNPSEKSPIRYEIYSPENKFFVERESKRNGGKIFFTLNKKYPVFEEKIPSLGSGIPEVLYVVVDDKGDYVTVSDKLFVPIPKMENFSVENNESNGLTDKGLAGSFENVDMPNLRGN